MAPAEVAENLDCLDGGDVAVDWVRDRSGYEFEYPGMGALVAELEGDFALCWLDGHFGGSRAIETDFLWRSRL